MPKGVEHSFTLKEVWSELPCVESLMPKGVEHDLSNPSLWQLVCVESLMPKGVEHLERAV